MTIETGVRHEGWTVYILECADRTFYTGITTDIHRRVAEHNNGVGAKYTRGRRPVVVAYTEASLNRSTASKREQYIKRLTRGAKLELILHN